MPALSKPPEDKTGHHAPPRELVARAGAALEPPPAPAGLPVALRRQWVDLWRSPVATLLDPDVDGPVVARLFELYALGADVAGTLAVDARAERTARRDLARARADGDLEAMADAALRLETARKSYNATIGARVRVATETRMLEAQLGLSPRSRLALGVMLLAGRKAMAGAVDPGDEDEDY